VGLAARAGFFFKFFVYEEAGTVGSSGGELVAAVIIGVICMAPDPDKADGILF